MRAALPALAERRPSQDHYRDRRPAPPQAVEACETVVSVSTVVMWPDLAAGLREIKRYSTPTVASSCPGTPRPPVTYLAATRALRRKTPHTYAYQSLIEASQAKAAPDVLEAWPVIRATSVDAVAARRVNAVHRVQRLSPSGVGPSCGPHGDHGQLSPRAQPTPAK